MDPKARGNSHPPRFKIERRQMLLITGPDAGRLSRRLSRDEPPPRRPRYLLAKKRLNDFFQRPIRMPLLSVIKELRNPRISQ